MSFHYFSPLIDPNILSVTPGFMRWKEQLIVDWPNLLRDAQRHDLIDAYGQSMLDDTNPTEHLERIIAKRAFNRLAQARELARIDRQVTEAHFAAWDAQQFGPDGPEAHRSGLTEQEKELEYATRDNPSTYERIKALNDYRMAWRDLIVMYPHRDKLQEWLRQTDPLLRKINVSAEPPKPSSRFGQLTIYELVSEFECTHEDGFNELESEHNRRISRRERTNTQPWTDGGILEIMRFDAQSGFWPEQNIDSSTAPYLVQENARQEQPDMTHKPSAAVMTQLGLKVQKKTEEKVADPLVALSPDQLTKHQPAHEHEPVVKKILKLTGGLAKRTASLPVELPLARFSDLSAQLFNQFQSATNHPRVSNHMVDHVLGNLDQSLDQALAAYQKHNPLGAERPRG